jgi:hypothetical protein
MVSPAAPVHCSPDNACPCFPCRSPHLLLPLQVTITTLHVIAAQGQEARAAPAGAKCQTLFSPKIRHCSFERHRDTKTPSLRPSKHTPHMIIYPLCAATHGITGVHRWGTQCRALCRGEGLAVVGRLTGSLYRVCSAPPDQDAIPATIQAHTAHDYVSIVCCNAWEHRGAPLGRAVPRTLIGEHLQASNGPPSSTPGVHPPSCEDLPPPPNANSIDNKGKILLVTEDSGWGVKRGYYWSFTTACLSERCWPG